MPHFGCQRGVSTELVQAVFPKSLFFQRHVIGALSVPFRRIVRFAQHLVSVSDMSPLISLRFIESLLFASHMEAAPHGKSPCLRGSV